MLPWLLLILAACLEICWMYSLKFLDFGRIRRAPWSEILTNKEVIMSLLPLIGYILFGLANVFCFSMATKYLSISLAFGVWMGLALVGSRLVDTFVFHEGIQWKQIVFMGMILVGIVGLKTSST